MYIYIKTAIGRKPLNEISDEYAIIFLARRIYVFLYRSMYEDI